MIFDVIRPSADSPKCTKCGRPGAMVRTMDTEPMLAICEACMFAALYGGALPDGYKPRHYPTKEEIAAEKERLRALRGAVSMADDERGRLSVFDADARGRLTVADIDQEIARHVDRVSRPNVFWRAYKRLVGEGWTR